MWIAFAFLSATAAGLSSILAKVGIGKTSSEVATAIRTAIVLVMSLIMVFIVGSTGGFAEVSAKSWVFLVLSGIATGASWLCFFKALQLGDVNKVIPVDKTSIVLTLLVSFFMFGEKVTVMKIVAVVAIGAGTFLMIEKKHAAPVSETVSEPAPAGELTTIAPVTDGLPTVSQKRKIKLGWLPFACLSAIFATLTTILGKIGIDGVESNLGTFIRTAVVLVMSWIVVFATKKGGEVMKISARDLLFIILSGIATGVSWLCYYRALKDGVVSVVVSIDKLSMLLTIAFSYFVLKEKLSVKALIGMLLIVAGTMILLFIPNLI